MQVKRQEGRTGGESQQAPQLTDYRIIISVSIVTKCEIAGIGLNVLDSIYMTNSTRIDYWILLLFSRMLFSIHDIIYLL